MTPSGAGYPLAMSARDPYVEEPEDKDLQDHTFGVTAAAQQEAADEGATAPKTDEPEPHASGKA